MPLYEYLCDACGHRFELIKKFSDPPVEKCPKCGGAVHKLQSAPAFHLKGTGWYLTDYAKKDQPAGDKSEGGTKDSKEEATGTKDAAGKAEKSEKAPSTNTSESTSTTPTAPTPSKDKPAKGSD
jgi:putative FmdB family regulatory protein